MKKFKISCQFLIGGEGFRIEEMRRKAKNKKANFEFCVKAENKQKAEELGLMRIRSLMRQMHKGSKKPLPSKLVENYNYKGAKAQMVDVDLNGDIWAFIDQVKVKKEGVV